MRAGSARRQLTGTGHFRAVGVADGQVKVVRLPHASVLQDEITRGTIRPNAVGRSSRRAPHVVGFNPVAVSVPDKDSPNDILADSVSLDSVPVALARVAKKIDAVVAVPADGTIGNRVPVALAGGAAGKNDAIAVVAADGTIGNRVPVALAAEAIKIDAIAVVSADGAIGNRVPVALAAVAIKKDAIAVIARNHHLLDPAVVHVLTIQTPIEPGHRSILDHHFVYQRIRRPDHMDAIVSGTDTIPRQGEAHQVDADAAGLNHNAVRRGKKQHPTIEGVAAVGNLDNVLTHDPAML